MSRISLRVKLIALIVLNASFMFAQSVQIESWITNPDRSSSFEKQPVNISFSEKGGGRGSSTIVVDDLQQMQTINGDTITCNIAYYTVAHASKFVRPGSVWNGKFASLRLNPGAVGTYVW